MTQTSVSRLEEMIGSLRAHHATAMIAFAERLVGYDAEVAEYLRLRSERVQTRTATSVSAEMTDTILSQAIEYAHKTFAPQVADGVETRCGGLLLILADFYEPGMSTPYVGSDGSSLPARISRNPEVYLGKGIFASGASVLDDERPGLNDILSRYERNPHHQDHDQAIFINEGNGEIESTRAHVEGVYDCELGQEPNGHTGGTRFSAGRYITQENPHSIAVMVSAGDAVVYVFQHGRVKLHYDVETRTGTEYEPLTLANEEPYRFAPSLIAA